MRPGSLKKAVGDDAALQGFVLVMMGCDEAGHHDRARAVDDFSVGRIDDRCNRGNPLVGDENVRLLEIANFRIQSEHDAAAQQDAALATVADETLSVRLGGGANAGQRPLRT